MRRADVELVVWTAATVAAAVFGAGSLACGGNGWTPADTAGATQTVRAEALIEQMCADAGACVPAQVRALERAALCNSESMLFRHGATVPEAGVTCQAP